MVTPFCWSLRAGDISVAELRPVCWATGRGVITPTLFHPGELRGKVRVPPLR